MHDMAEIVGGIVLIVVVFIAYLACGTFFAWLFGLEGGLTYTLFVLAWPVPVGVAFVLLWFGMSIALAVARAVVR